VEDPSIACVCLIYVTFEDTSLGLLVQRFIVTDWKAGMTKAPFSMDYLKEELEWYGNTDTYKSGSVEVRNVVIPIARLDDYFNVNMYVDLPPIPTLYIDGTLWMSLTPMEIQSAWVPIQDAYGRVATGGLGLGYITLKWMEDDKVDHIDVYEMNEEVVRHFVERFSDREGFDKVNFIMGDMRENMDDKTYDYVWVDIYATMLPDEVISDAELFMSNNDIDNYRFWGEERVVLDYKIMECSGEKLWNEDSENELFKRWMDATTEDGTPLVDLWSSVTTCKFNCDVLVAVGRLMYDC
jgi:hypothetical protein